MSRDEQIQFVRDRINAVLEDVIESIDIEKVPADWRGPELDLLLAVKFARNDTIAGKRRANCNNVITITTL